MSTAQESAPSSLKPNRGSALVSARVWTVKCPPPLNSLKGALIPKALSTKRLRKISIEIHRINAGGKEGTYEECLVRILEPANKQMAKAAKALHNSQLAQRVNNAIRPVAESVASSVTHDDASVVDVPSEYRVTKNDYFAEPDFDKGWQSKYRFPISCLAIKGTSKTGVYTRITLGHASHTRQLIFDSIEEAEDFCSVIQQELKLEKERGDAKLRFAFSGKKIPKDSNVEITYLFEVVSAWNIIAGDVFSSDPYMLITANGKEIHRTKHISKTLDPIWTLKTDSLFLYTVSTKDLLVGHGLTFTLRDFDQVGNDEFLGSFVVDGKTIFEAKGERLEYKLEDPEKGEEIPGHAAIRIRKASPSDIKFIKEYKNSKKRGVLGSGRIERDVPKEELKGGASNIASYFRRQKRVVKEGKKEIHQFKVRPGPDPDREEETLWMTEKDLRAAVVGDSNQWIDTGNGDLGRLFVEVISCEGLPNLDSGGRNKTDAFVSIVFEDCVVKTDIIDDCLSPMWPPWSQRAFIFHMFHSSSQIFLGVFDYDDGVNPADDHDLIGRVAVDLTNLCPDTTYTLKYNIFTTAKMLERKQKGTITVRLRIEIPDQRKLLLSNLEPPPDMYVNVKKRKDYKLVHYTCTGKHDMSRYDMKYIKSYIQELIGLQHSIYYIQDAVVALMLWRGTFHVRVLGKDLYLPVHSLFAFLSLVTLIERPQLFPAMFFAFMGWFLMATMDYRSRLPNPWIRCKTFSDFLLTLVFGAPKKSTEAIEAFENADESQKYMEEWTKRITDAEEAAAKAYEENVRAQEEYEREMDEIGEATTDISTKRGGVSIDPFKPILYPVQQNLGVVCRYKRYAQNIVSWEECYLSFWVTVGCFVLSFICMFVPWFFLMKWSARIVVWIAFGPWMKLVDVFYVQKIKPLSAEEEAKKRERERQQRKEATSALLAEARIKRENAAKLKAMKKYLFGKFITRVPVLKEDLYRDTPLPDSTAVPYKPELLPLSEVAMQEAGYNRKRVPGQHLVGDMIPSVEDVGFTQAPTGQATAHPRMVDRSGPGGAVGNGHVSDAQAYAKIGTVVVGAAVVSWFVVPLFSAVTEQALKWF